jgi:hypothetical protein
MRRPTVLSPRLQLLFLVEFRCGKREHENEDKRKRAKKREQRPAENVKDNEEVQQRGKV